MNRKPFFTRQITKDEWTWTILGLGILFGAYVRILPALSSGFPLNDGGMFAVMMRDLIAHHFSLPVFTTYNNLGIPFAYPPFGIFVGALFEVFGFSESWVLLWIPAFFAIAIIPLYFLLALELLEDGPRASLATLFSTLIPGTYTWTIMGGGLTRSPGMVFLILTLYFSNKAFRTLDWRITGWATVFFTFTILSHPQAALLAAVGIVVSWLFRGRTKISTWHVSFIVSASALLASPWWVLIISRHGLDVFLSASQSGDLHASFENLFKSLVYRQTILPFTTLFLLFGLFWVVYKGKFQILVLGLGMYLIDQRSAPIFSGLMYPMLAAYGLLDVCPALLFWIKWREWREIPNIDLINSKWLSQFTLLLILYIFFESVFYITLVQNKYTLSLPAQEMMLWVKQNTGEDDGFILFTGSTDPMTDPVQEWFPALTFRHSATTLQGLEWHLRKNFQARWKELSSLQKCTSVNCVCTYSKEIDPHFTYMVMNKNAVSMNDITIDELQVVFDNRDYVIAKACEVL